MRSRFLLFLLLLWSVCGLTSCHKEETVFTELDLNQDRRLSLTELETGVTDGLFKTYDADKDGFITLAEWRKKDPQGEPSFFRQRDLNRDGRITWEESMTSLRKRGFCREVLQQADRNDNQLIEAREARVWISDHPEVIARLKLGD